MRFHFDETAHIPGWQDPGLMAWPLVLLVFGLMAFIASFHMKDKDDMNILLRVSGIVMLLASTGVILAASSMTVVKGRFVTDPAVIVSSDYSQQDDRTTVTLRDEDSRTMTLTLRGHRKVAPVMNAPVTASTEEVTVRRLDDTYQPLTLRDVTRRYGAPDIRGTAR